MAQPKQHRFFQSRMDIPRFGTHALSLWNTVVLVFLSLAIMSFLLGGALFYQFAVIRDVATNDTARTLSGGVNKSELEKVTQTLDKKEALLKMYEKEKIDFANPSL